MMSPTQANAVIPQDLSTVTFPVTFNEPLTLLQRAAEEVEYYNLLTQAAAVTDPVERLGFVAAFAVSSYAHTRYRSSRKGLSVLVLCLLDLTDFILEVTQCLRRPSRTREWDSSPRKYLIIH